MPRDFIFIFFPAIDYVLIFQFLYIFDSYYMIFHNFKGRVMARNSAKKMIFCLPSSLWYKNKRVSQGKIEEVARDEFRFGKVEGSESIISI